MFEPAGIEAGKVFLIDKPLGWTSFDVVNKIRYHFRFQFGLKKLKVGHAGTLDPMASGLLIVCVGKKTKSIDDFMGLDKTYTGCMRLGATTASYDAETPEENHRPTQFLKTDDLETCRQQFLGQQMQVPPLFSAVKVKGKKAYELARKGRDLTLDARPVTIKKFVLTAVDLPDLHFEVHCSKGTYLRSLAHDFGQCLGSGAYLSALKRTAIGDFQLKDAWKLEDWLRAHSRESGEPQKD